MDKLCNLSQMFNRNFFKKSNIRVSFSFSFSFSLLTCRAKPVDCGTELNVLNYMHSVNPTTPNNDTNQLTVSMVDSCNEIQNNQTNNTS